MKVRRFDTRRDLIMLDGRVWGPRKDAKRRLRLVLDTGAAETIIIPEILDELGYNPLQGEAITVMRSAVGREEGYLIRVTRFACLGHQENDFRVHAHDLPEGWHIDGLIGLSFLRQLNYEIRSVEAGSWPSELPCSAPAGAAMDLRLELLRQASRDSDSSHPEGIHGWHDCVRRIDRERQLHHAPGGDAEPSRRR